MKKPLSLFLLLAVLSIVSFDGRAVYFPSSVDAVIVDTPAVNLVELKQDLLKQADVIDVNWFHTMNPLVKNAHGRLIWSSLKQQGLVFFSGLSKTSHAQYYQLWVYDLESSHNLPVSLLNFQVNSRDAMVIRLKSRIRVKRPYKFELTLEDSNEAVAQQLLMAQP